MSVDQSLQDSINAVRADKKINVPVVMTREEVAAVISLMDGTAQVVAKLLYGSGLRIMEAIRLRVKDVDFQMKQLTVRSGKGDKDRFTTFPVTLTPLFQNHLAGVKKIAVFIHKNGFVSPLEYMPCLRMFPVVLLGLDAAELSHPTREVSLRCREDKMVMVIHEAPGMAEPMESVNNKPEQIQEVLSVFVASEFLFPACLLRLHGRGRQDILS